MKKIFSLILAFMLIFTCSVNAFADEVTSEQSIVEEDVMADETQTVLGSSDENDVTVQEPSDNDVADVQDSSVEDAADVSDSSVEDTADVSDSSVEDATDVSDSSVEDTADVPDSSGEDNAETQVPVVGDDAENAAENIGEAQNAADTDTVDENAADTGEAKVKTLEQKLSEAKEVTSLPFSEAVNITEADEYAIGAESFYGKAYKISLAAGDAFRVKFYGNNVDTVIDMYKYNGSSYELVISQDAVEPFDAETVEHYCAEAGEYYFIARTFDTRQAACTFELELLKYSEAITLEEVPEKAEVVPEFPFKTTAQMGGPSGMIEVSNDGFFLGIEAYKFDLDKNECINFSFDTSEENAPFMCYILSSNLQLGNFYFADNYSNGGKAAFFAKEAGEYYLCMFGEFYNTPTSYPLTIESVSYPSVADLINSAYSIDSISGGGTYSEKINFDGSVAYAPDTNVNSNFYYAKAYKATLSATDTLFIDFAGFGGINTVIAVYEKAGETYNFVKMYNNNDLMDRGECVEFTPGKAGEYYIIARTFNQSECDTMLDIAFNIHPTNPYTGLDFTSETPPVPEEGDLWSWDAASKTLTLKDGFSIEAFYEDAIILPDGAVLEVEPGASVSASSAEWYAVWGMGALTISIGEGSTLNLSSGIQYGIYVNDSLTITGAGSGSSVLNINNDGNQDGIKSGPLTISGISLNVNCGGDGMVGYGDITITSCNININSYDQGIQAQPEDGHGVDMIIKDSVLNIVSTMDQALYAYDLSLINCDSTLSSPYDDGIRCLVDDYGEGGAFICTGGTLKVDSYDHSISADSSIEISNTKLNLRSITDEAIHCTAEKPVLDAANKYNVYSADGNVYTGELQIILTYSDGSYVARDGSPILKIVPVYAVTFYDEDGVAVLKETQYVEEGAAAAAPEDPVKESDGKYEYTFAGWSEAFDSVKSDMDIKATYTATAITPEDPDPQKPGGEDNDQQTPGGSDKDPDKNNDQKPDSVNDTGKDAGKAAAPTTGDANDILLPVMLIAVCGIAAAIAKRKF
jgi:hypothetical protein